jgi:hypothetical protein
MVPEPDRYRRLRAVFDQALRLDSSAREAYLDQACAGDPALRAHAARLLAAHRAHDSFLEHPARLFAANDNAADFTGTDRFRVLRQLGRGGMGIVYQVHDAHRDEVVALKTLRRSGAVDLYRLKREFRSLTDVAHPNIVCLYELFVEDDRPFFTMEHVRGVNFVEFVRAGDRAQLSIDRLTGALPQLIDGLTALHRRGMLHRDVKPSNVLVTAEGRAVLLDFGLIAESGSTRVRDLDGGTPAYMSPEEAAGSAPTEAGYWYGVGATLYEALTGRLPFEGSVASVLRAKQIADPPAPNDVDANVPAALSALCMGLLDRDPSRRLSTAGALHVPVRDPVRAGSTRATATFVGRGDQLAVLHAAQSNVARGAAHTISLHGPSGIGKSALARQFLAEAAADDAVILVGRCYENESVPYKGLDGVVDELSRHLASLTSATITEILPDSIAALARVFPVLRRVGAIERAAAGAGVGDAEPFRIRRRAVGALRELLGRMAARQRVIIWIDDLQWANADSMQLLDELLAPPHPPVMLTLLSFRGEEVQAKPFLQAVIERSGQSGHAAVSLEPMSEAEARMLVDALIPGGVPVSDDDRRRLTRDAAGSPFVLEQLALYAGDAITTLQASPTLAGMFDRRLDSLTAEARLFLETLAICGRPMPADVICEASGIANDRHSLIVTLRASHLIRSSGSADRIEAYHDRIREALSTRVPADGVRRIHGRIAASLVARDSDDCEALFEHHRGAGDLDRAARQAALAADKAAATLAFDRAASFYRHAIDLMPAAATAAIRKQLAVALTNAGRPAEAAEAYLRAAVDVDHSEQIVLQRAAAEQFLIGGHVDRGFEELAHVLKRVGLRYPSSPRTAAVLLVWRRARLWFRGLQFRPQPASEVSPADLLRLDACWAVGTGLALIDIVSACSFLAQHLHLALDAGELSRVARGMAVEFAARQGVSRYRRGARRLEQLSLELSARVGTPQAHAMQLLADSIAAVATGQWTRAQASSERSLAILRDQCVGVKWEMTIAQNTFIWSLMYRGQLGELSRRVPAILEDARRRGNLYLAAELVTRSNFVWLAADDPGGGERELNSTMSQWSKLGFHRQHYSAMLARMQTALYRGDPCAAWQVLEDNEAQWRASMLIQVQALRVEYHYMRGRCAIAVAAVDANPRRWLSAAGKYARRIAAEQMPWSDPLAHLLEAGIASVRGARTAAAGELRQAVAQFDASDMQLYAHVSRRRLGDLLDDEEGRAMRRQADAWMSAQLIRNPANLTRMLAPGFSASCHNAEVGGSAP